MLPLLFCHCLPSPHPHHSFFFPSPTSVCFCAATSCSYKHHNHLPVLLICHCLPPLHHCSSSCSPTTQPTASVPPDPTKEKASAASAATAPSPSSAAAFVAVASAVAGRTPTRRHVVQGAASSGGRLRCVGAGVLRVQHLDGFPLRRGLRRPAGAGEDLSGGQHTLWQEQPHY